MANKLIHVLHIFLPFHQFICTKKKKKIKNISISSNELDSIYWKLKNAKKKKERERKGCWIYLKGKGDKIECIYIKRLNVIHGHSSRERGPLCSRTLGTRRVTFRPVLHPCLYKHSPNDNCYRVENTPRPFRKNAIGLGMGEWGER